MKKDTFLLLISILLGACSAAKEEVEYYKIDPVQMAKTVTITRDKYGIPHISGPSDESVLFGLAFARAEDHFDLIEDAVISSLGRQSEIRGESSIPFDYEIRAFKVADLSKKEYEGLNNKTKLLCDAYTAGINYYLTTHPKVSPKLITLFEPWYFLAVERGIWTSMGFPQTGLREDEVSEYLIDRRVEPQVGSNMWAISPKKTKNGKTYLVINPHIPSDQPYEVHIKSEEGWNFYGMMAYGTNVIPVIGHNQSIAWSLTVNYPDVGDAFTMTFDHPTDSLKYKFDGDYLTAETWVDSIQIKTDSGMVSKKYNFMRTIHGPVLTRDDDQYTSYRVAGMEEGGSLSQFYQMSKSNNLRDFKAAIANMSVAFHNFMYADKEGNIMYVYNGTIPRRDPSLDWTKPVDGSDPRSKWKGYHTLDELPQLLNPAIGYLQNCNSNPFSTIPTKNPKPSKFPAYMTNLQHDTKRAERSKIILDSMREVTIPVLERAIMDTYVQRAEETLTSLFTEYDSLLAVDKGRALRIKQPIAALKSWDRRANIDSREASLYFIYDELLFSTASSTQWSKVSCLEKTINLMEKDQGTWEVAWGDIMRHQRTPDNNQYGVTDSLPNYPLPGGPGGTGIMFCVWPPGIQDKITRRSNGGHSYVAIVEFGEKVKAKSIVPYGNSRDPDSPHYLDQAELYAKGQFKEVLFTAEEIEQNIEAIYHPGDRKRD